MNPRLISTPRLSVRERAMLLTLLIFQPKKAAILLQRVAGARSEALQAQLKETPKAELKLLVVELRRMLDQRFEGLSQVHSSWLVSSVENESAAIRAAWLSDLPTASISGATRRPPPRLLSLLRAQLMRGLVEMPPEPRDKALQRRHLADLPEPALQKLLSLIQPQELGSALSDLGQEIAQKLAQRLPKPRGLLLLQGHANPIANTLPLLLRAAEKSGIPLER
jgi:hypothetical protein